MKFALPFAALAIVAVPGSAEVVERTTVVHNGRSVAVSYEPVIESSFNQANIGPRANATCLWTSKVAVRRTAVDPQGTPIVALERIVADEQTHSGQFTSPCAGVSKQSKARLSGGEETLRSQVAAAAKSDAQRLHADLASISLLAGGESSAR